MLIHLAMRPVRVLITAVIGCLTLLLVFLNSKSHIELTGNLVGDAPEVSLEDVNNIQAYRYVTPSLAELGGKNTQTRTNKHMLMVTRIPDAGAEILVLLLQRLQGYNAFKHVRLPPGDSGLLSTLQQELLVEEITSIARQEAIPLSFDGDVRFLNFSAFGRQAPVYVSLLRNPLDVKNSRRFQQKGGAVAHFCGQDRRCSERNNGWALKKAKENILEWYSVIGVLDRMEETLSLLEREFPYFFKGATRLYESIRARDKHSSDTFIPLKGRDEETRRLLADEMELYRWSRGRLLDQVSDKG